MQENDKNVFWWTTPSEAFSLLLVLVVVPSSITDLCVCCGVWRCRMTAGTSYRPLPRPPLPPPPDPRLLRFASERKPAAAESEHSAHPQLENTDHSLKTCTHNKTPHLHLRAVVPFSVCSMICLMAFFRLLARSISCSLGLKMAAEEVVLVRGEHGVELGGVWGTGGGWRGGGNMIPSASSCSSAMVGGGAGGRTVEAWDSSFRVFNKESSFSFRTPHWDTKTSETGRVSWSVTGLTDC